jgi:integrase
VEVLASEWLESNPAKRSGTRARDDGIIERHINPAMGPRAIGSVTPPQVQNLVNAWTKSAAPRTVIRQYGVLTAMFSYAVNSDYIGRSPCRNIKLPKVKPVKRNLPDTEGLARLAAELEAYALMMWVGVLTGLRWAEVAGLRVGSVDLLEVS